MAKFPNWRPMKTAPRDGTIILVCETPNGEHWNVLPACYINMGGPVAPRGTVAHQSVGWWAVSTTKRGCASYVEGGDCPLPVNFKPLFATPVCWMPMPPLPNGASLRKKLMATEADMSMKCKCPDCPSAKD